MVLSPSCHPLTLRPLSPTQVDAAKRLVGIKLTTGDFPAAAPAAAVASEPVAVAAVGGEGDGF